jgi:beta-lactamase regulating signal transducer with metallopeptidase domain
VPDLFGLLLSLPTESVAVRAVVGSVAGLALATLLLRGVLRTPRVRTSAALIPVAAIVGAIAASWGQLQLPVIMTANGAAEGLGPFLVRDTYVRFAPLTWPLLAIWFVLAGARISRRTLAMRRMRDLASGGAPPRDMRVHPTVSRLARTLGVPEPRVVVARDCPGGAALVGIRDPVVVVDAAVLARLDDEELEGLLAHELAHVRRRDNLLAAVVGSVRDVCFFVPGGRWVIRRLCAERELAADVMAVEATHRPGALASGLLKVIDERRPVACAAFAAPAALVTRVERLVRDEPATGPLRTVAESAAVAGAFTVAVAVAVHLPAAVAAQATEEGWARDALAVVWTWQGEGALAEVPEATALDVYRRSTPYEPSAVRAIVPTASGGQEFTPAYLRGEGALSGGDDVVHTRGAVPPWPDAVVREWRATPVVASPDGMGLYWLHDLETGGSPGR